MDPLRNGAAGVVSSAKLFRPEDFADLTTIMASRYRARASRPSAALSMASQLLVSAAVALESVSLSWDCCYFSGMAPIMVILLLIVINGIFVMAEMALVSSRKPRLQQLANEGDGGAQVAIDLSTNPDRFLATTQIGITLIAILAGAFGQRTLTERLSIQMERLRWLASYREGLAFA